MFRRYSTVFQRYSMVMALALLLPVITAAQSGPAGVGGVVKDESGAVIPGASIRIVNEASNAAVDLFSDEQGTYRALDLEPGSYRVETTLDGFETVVNRVVVEAGQAAANDVVLSPARFSQSVVVTARRTEEVAQEAFLKAFKYIRQFRAEARFSTWLLQITVNEARMRRRRGSVIYAT